MIFHIIKVLDIIWCNKVPHIIKLKNEYNIKNVKDIVKYKRLPYIRMLNKQIICRKCEKYEYCVI